MVVGWTSLALTPDTAGISGWAGAVTAVAVTTALLAAAGLQPVGVGVV